MNHRIVATFATAILTLAPCVVTADKGDGPILPPQASYRGLSQAEWGVLWSQRAIEVNLVGSSDIPETLRNVRLLPTVVAPGEYEFDVTIPPGTGLMTCPFFIFGEHYDNPDIPDDTPELIDELGLFETAEIEVTLDGRVVFAGTGTSLDRYHFGPTYFEPPIEYAEPQFRFFDENNDPVFAVEAIFIEGLATLYHPLPPGHYTMVQHMSSPFFGEFVITYNIHVSR